MADIDLVRWRRDTPAARNLVHLNNAGAALPPDRVVDAVIEVVRLEARVGGYEAAARLAERRTAIHGNIARLINAAPDEIALVESATIGWASAFQAIAATLAPGDRILTGPGEYISNFLAFLQAKARWGLEVDVAPATATGEIDVAAMERLVGPRTRLVAVTHAPSNDGLLNPVVEVGRLARRHGLWYLLDACQSVGQMAVDVVEIGCDALAATGRKFLRGPRGTGFLYVRSERASALEPLVICLQNATLGEASTYRLAPGARRFETFESSIAAQIGLGEAVAYALEVGIDVIERRARLLAGDLRGRLRELPGCRIEDHGIDRSAIVTASFETRSALELRAELAAQGINVHVAGRNDRTPERRVAPDDVNLRLSPHYYNDASDLDRAIEALRRVTVV